MDLRTSGEGSPTEIQPKDDTAGPTCYLRGAATTRTGLAMRILYVEPYEGGSHAAFSRALTAGIPAHWTALTLPARHWKWRMRGVVAHLVLDHAEDLARPHDLLLCSSYVPLAELVGLCPRLAEIPRVLYFHENQLTFPARDGAGDERDLHYGFTQMVSALAATRCVFNSAHNRDGFLAAAADLLRHMPDAVPHGWVDRIRGRSDVLPVPLDLPDDPNVAFDDGEDRGRGPVILWNHRWEHDKNPEAFFAALDRLQRDGVPFRVAVCGQRFREVPPVFETARARLGDRVIHWGYCESRAEYEALLGRAHLVVSSARHEFFGLSVLEAVHFGARPVLPDRLSYRELFPPKLRYADDGALAPTLAELARGFVGGRISLRADRRAITRPYLAGAVLPRYEALFRELARGEA